MSIRSPRRRLPSSSATIAAGLRSHCRRHCRDSRGSSLSQYADFAIHSHGIGADVPKKPDVASSRPTFCLLLSLFRLCRLRRYSGQRRARPPPASWRFRASLSFSIRQLGAAKFAELPPPSAAILSAIRVSRQAILTDDDAVAWFTASDCSVGEFTQAGRSA